MSTNTLPPQWALVKLGDMATLIQYGLTATAQENIDGVLFLRISDIDDDGNVGLQSPKYIPADTPGLSRYVLEPGDIVIARSGSVGRGYVYQGSDDPWVFASYLIRFRLNTSVALPEYIGFFLRSPYYWQYVTGMMRAVAQPNINSKELAALHIPLPPLPEQRRIVAILREADELRRLRREADATARALLPALFVEMFGDVDVKNSQWNIVTVADAGEVQLGRQRAPKYQTGKYTHPYVRVANVYEDRIDTSDVLSMDFEPAEFQKYKLGYGDILLNEGQSAELVGRPAVWRNEVPDCCFQNTLIRFRANLSKTDPDFAFAVFLTYFRTGKFEAIGSKTSNVAHLGASRFAKMPFPLPPLELQQEFATKAIVLRDIEGEQSHNRQQIDELFASLLARAFSGELTAAWRAAHADELRDAAVQRDIALGVRGVEATIEDVREGRLTREEEMTFRSSFGDAISTFADSLVEHPLVSFKDLIQFEPFVSVADLVAAAMPKFGGSFTEQLNITLGELGSIVVEPIAASFSGFSDVDWTNWTNVGGFSDVDWTNWTNVAGGLQLSGDGFKSAFAGLLATEAFSLNEFFQQPTATRHILRPAGYWMQADQGIISMLARAEAAANYFRPEHLVNGDGNLTETEDRLQVLAALGFVRQVHVSGHDAYRLVDAVGERALADEWDR